jgi:peroxiredoxin
LGDFKGKKNVVLAFYADSSWSISRRRLGELQEKISEIEAINAEVIAFATSGNQDDVETSKSVQGITFTLIPKPNRKVVEDFGLKYDSFGAVYATIIIDKGGIIRFKNVYDIDSASTIIRELQGIQWYDASNIYAEYGDPQSLWYHHLQLSGPRCCYLLSILTNDTLKNCMISETYHHIFR